MAGMARIAVHTKPARAKIQKILICPSRSVYRPIPTAAELKQNGRFGLAAKLSSYAAGKKGHVAIDEIQRFQSTGNQIRLQETAFKRAARHLKLLRAKV